MDAVVRLRRPDREGESMTSALSQNLILTDSLPPFGQTYAVIFLPVSAGTVHLSAQINRAAAWTYVNHNSLLVCGHTHYGTLQKSVY